MLMRKSYLIFAGMLFLGVSAFAQPNLNDPRNAKVIFHQDFEATEGLTDEQSYIEWSRTPIDTIKYLEYYSKLGTSTPRSTTGDIYDGSADWEIFAVRTDSTSSEWTQTNPGDGIIIFNGVEVSSSASEKANNVYAADSYTIVNDGGNDSRRTDAFAQYGESGGKSYFQYTTGGIDASKISSSHYSTSTRSTKNYRRDLYVRGLDIEDSTSYRLTFYIKASKTGPNVTWDPLFYADLMRGYHHQRATFSMGYKSGKDFAFSKDDFEDGKWEKITIMSYYISDREADGYVMYKGDYSWTDDWCWRPTDDQLAAWGKTLPEGETLNYIKQPDKFFVRLSFSTDSIEYSLDNLSLTKSWIAGCEYDKDKMRVDFGYETNLAALAKAAEAETGIDAVEVPNSGYVTVWGLRDNDKWENVPIASIEYHGDGYMYMFTPTIQVAGQAQKVQFKQYKQVLVSFKNPTDKEGLGLQYTGSLYPKAMDSVWINAGKYVPDFYNELATPNPYAFDGVYSMKELPPVMQEPQYEDGSFGLDAKTRKLKFKFSRQLEIDDKGESSNYVIAYVGNEVWTPSWDTNESSLVITRPDNYQNDLSGDYEIELVHLFGIGTPKGKDVVLNYHFGDFTTTPADAVEYTHSDWRSEFNDRDNNTGVYPPSCWMHNYVSSGTSFLKGDGEPAPSNSTVKVRVYILDYPTNNIDNCGFYLASRDSKARTDEKYLGHVYTTVNFTEAGDYSIKFKATAWEKLQSEGGTTTSLKFYPAPSGDENSYAFATFTDVADKTTLGTFIPETKIASSSTVKDKSTGKWPDEVETFEYSFKVPAAGKYVFEWVCQGGNSSGIMFGNYTISKMAQKDLSTDYVKKLNNAVALAETRLADAAPAKYRCREYDVLSQAIAEGKVYKGNFPSKYDSVVAYVNDRSRDLKLRMDTVDLFYTTQEDVATALAAVKGDSVRLAVYQTLNTHMTSNANYDCSTQTTAQITAEIEAYKSEMKALEDRLTLMENYATLIQETKSVIDAAKRNDFDEYAAMVRGYNTALQYNVITPTDAEISAAHDALVAAKNGYVFRYDYFIAKTRQTRELYAFVVDTLGYDFGAENAVIKSAVEEYVDAAPHMDSLLRETAILQILKLYQAGDPQKVLDSLNVSVLIPNYYLYNEAQVGRDLDQSSSKVWRIIKDKDNTNVFPGWTVKNSGTAYPGKTAIDWEIDGHTFVGGLHFASSGYGKLSTVIEGLPQAYYYAGFELSSNDTKYASLTATTDSTNINIAGETYKTKQYQVLFIDDSVRVTAGSPLALSYEITKSSSSTTTADVTSAVIILKSADSKAKYDELVAAQQGVVTELLTVVNAPKAAKEDVQYFNLSGIQIDTPKSGEILIRRTVRNGKVTVDKVLFK